LAPPLNDSDAPTMIGPLGLLVGVVPLGLLALVQAASTLAASNTAALAANLVLVNRKRGRADLTSSVIPAETAPCRVNGMKTPRQARRASAHQPGRDAVQQAVQACLGLVLRSAESARNSPCCAGRRPCLGRDANVALRLLGKYVLSPLAPHIKYWSTPR
jgi:hypothetical protein